MLKRHKKDPPKAAGNQSATEKAVEFIEKGSKLIKVRSKFSKNQRHFKIVNDGSVLTYKGSKKVKCINKSSAKAIDIAKGVRITAIKEIRHGARSDTFALSYGLRNIPPDDQCFSIIIGDREEEILDLVAPNHEVQEMWIHGITELQKRLSEISPKKLQELWLKDIFHQADKDHDGDLSIKEITTLLNEMNLAIDEEHAAMKIIKRQLNFAEFCELFENIVRREEVEELFKNYSDGKNYWTKEDMMKFFKCEQMEKLSFKQCEKLILDNESCPDMKDKHWLSLAGFYAFVDSDQMNLKNAICRTVYQDMNQPLSHYFIDSSHNTYLESDQIAGYSKAESYIKALKSGCRCVELDVWDGHTEPMICHGFTLTSKITFAEVIRVINQYGFVKSKYPLILSIENHCSVEQQRIMADCMQTVFGEKLFRDECVPGSNYLPPPSHLMERIIVKAKKLPPDLLENDSLAADGANSSTSEDTDSEAEAKLEKAEHKYSLAVELSDCINICQAVHFTSFKSSAAKHRFFHIISFNENKAVKLSKENAASFVQHNKRQLSRIYPSGKRIASSNYDPFPMWSTGCQLVALNYQTLDNSMLWNRGLFGDNGCCGYVLKPEFMRDFYSKATIYPDGPLPPDMKKTLAIKIISGFQLPKKVGDKTKSIIDPFIVVSIVGIPRDRRTENTRICTDNGFHPVWNEQFEFIISCPELALLYIRVIDKEVTQADMAVAHYCLPIRCIQNGYRTVHLKENNGSLLKSKLFVHIMIK